MSAASRWARAVRRTTSSCAAVTAQRSGQHAAAVSSCASRARPTASRPLRHEWRVAGVLSFGIRNLEARLANVAALADYHQRRWRESAAGFARAFALMESSTDEARNCPIKSSARVSVAARVAAAQRLLTDLGFSPGGDPGELSLTDKGLPRATFAGVKVGLVLGRGVAHALRGNRN